MNIKDKKGLQVPWNKGKKLEPFSTETRKKMSKSQKERFKTEIVWNKGLKGYMSGKNNGMWKGNEASYSAFHKWIYGKLGKPTKCEFCNKDNLNSHKIHWANKSRQYKR